MREHSRVIQCSCGETFESEKRFESHKKAEKAKEFNQAAQDWLDENLGGEIAKWHDETRGGMGGIGSYGTAEQKGMPTELTAENVREASIQFARDSLVSGNVEQLFYDEYHE